MNKPRYCTMILPDNVYEAIKEFQSELSQRDAKKWNFSDVIGLLLRFCLDDMHFIGKKDVSSLESFFEDKVSILDEIRSRILISTIFDDYYGE